MTWAALAALAGLDVHDSEARALAVAVGLLDDHDQDDNAADDDASDDAP